MIEALGPLLLLAAPLEAQAGADFVVEERSEEEIAAAIKADAEAQKAEKPDPAHPEAKLYDASIDASAALDTAIEKARARKVNVLAVLGANWCHDSRAFAGWTTTPRIGGMIAERFELVFINVGMPQTGDGHNLHIAERYNLGELEGTPTVLVIVPGRRKNGYLINDDTAKSWRNTASRSEDEIYEELAFLATTDVATD